MTLPVSRTASTFRRIPVIIALRELAQYRELIANLTMRELKARYKNSALGFLWSLLNPLGMMLIFTFVFTVMMPNQNLPHYPIFFLAGFLPWQFFSTGVTSSLTSIVANSNLVKKVYFPREVLPLGMVLAHLVNFLLALLVLFAAILISHVRLSPWLWLLPLAIGVELCFVLAMSLFLSTLNVFYRDTALIMDVVMQAWFFLTPVFYPIELLPKSYEIMGITVDIRRLMYIVNPMASLVATYRDLLYWGYRTNLDFFLRTAVTVLILLVAAYLFFLRFRARFGEEV